MTDKYRFFDDAHYEDSIMTDKYRIFVQANSFQSCHHTDCSRQGIHPANAFVAKSIGGPGQPPASIRHAAHFAAEASEGETMAVDLVVSAQKGRAVLLGEINGTFAGQRRLLRYLVGWTAPAKWWWLAINGGSAAAACFDFTDPVVCPTPEQLLGYTTRAEQLQAQKLLLEAPMDVMTEYMTQRVPELVQAGRVAYRRPKYPEPPTRGLTAWSERLHCDEMPLQAA